MALSGDNSPIGAVSYSDPNRTIESYMASLSQPATHAEFMNKASQLSKTNWDPKYLAITVINYVRARFDKAPLPE